MNCNLLTGRIWLLFPLTVLLLTGCARNSYNKSDIDNAARITNLLGEARDLSGFSISAAKNKIEEALQEAKHENQGELIVEGIILSARMCVLQGDNNDALNGYNQSLELAQGIQYVHGICEAKNAIGEIYYDWGEYDKSLLYFQEVNKIATDHRYLDCLAFALNMIGKYYHTKGNFEKAEEYFHHALEYSLKSTDHRIVSTVLIDRAKNYISLGKLNVALQSYLEAYKTCEKFNDKIVYATVCDHLGAFYQYIGQNKPAIQYYCKALESRRIMNNPDGMAKSLNNIGILLLNQNLPDSAYHYFEQSLKISRKTGYKKGIIKSLTNLGKVCQLNNKIDTGKGFLQEALDLATQAGYVSGVAEASLSLGNLYKTSHRPLQAISMFTLSLEKIKESNLYDIMRDNYLGLYECYLSAGDIKQALHYHVLILEIEKKLLDVENNKQLAILLISFDTERKEIDNRILKKDNELKEMTIKRESAFLWLFVAALGFSFLLSILIYGRFKNKQKANQILEDLNYKISKQNETLEILNKELERANKEKDIMFSILTHELRNPLFWFQNLSEMLSRKYQTMSPEKIKKTLNALDESAKNAFHLMDNLLNWSRSKLKQITIRKGNHSLETLVLETIRMYETIFQQKEIHLFTKIDKNAQVFVDPDLFGCVLRNLVSNSIKFTPAEGFIKVEAMEEESDFLIIIRDSGIGISSERIRKIFSRTEYFSSPGLMQEKGSGLGLKLCIEFVELNSGKIWVTSEPDKGTTFCFTIPKGVPQFDVELKSDALRVVTEKI